jgi:GNAT superfamily N-acetyltransferase
MDHRIQQYLRAVIEASRSTVAVDGFALYLHPRVRHPFVNYAVPTPDATSGDGRALRLAAEERGLIPRLEFVEPCFPWVQAALAPLGFEQEARLPLLTCTTPTVTAGPAGLRLEEVAAGSSLVGPLLMATHAAFGDPAPSDVDIAAWSGHSVAAILDGTVVGGASWTTVIDAMTEITGVAVVQDARSQGIGGALTACVVRQALTAGADCAVICAGDEGATRIYERTGFNRTSTMLHLRVSA